MPNSSSSDNGNVVVISGMFGDDKTYFADAPVVITISGLYWGSPVTSPFTIVRLEVVYDGSVIGGFHADTGGQSSISFDISTALRAIWSDYDFAGEILKAQDAVTAITGQAFSRPMRSYSLRVYTEYLSDDDGGVFVTTQCEDSQGNTTIPGGQCVMGGWTEWERSLITDGSYADVSSLEHTGARNGDASTKPTSSPERIGSTSISSWADVQAGLTRSIFYPATYANGQGEADDPADRGQPWNGHAPYVLRDSIPYTDFLFVNRRGAVESCSAQIKEALSINVETEQYARIERPAFKPSRTMTAISKGGRRSWNMSSGWQTREWADWWTMEFLKARRWWMLYRGISGNGTPRYVPVIVEPSKKPTEIYDRSKQQMPSVEFTVTLALEG